MTYYSVGQGYTFPRAWRGWGIPQTPHVVLQTYLVPLCLIVAALGPSQSHPIPAPNRGQLCVKAWLVLYLQHLRVSQILAILPDQLFTQCLQLTAKQDNPFCGSLVAPAELPPRMPIICTQKPAENTLEGRVGRNPRKLQPLPEAGEGQENRWSSQSEGALSPPMHTVQGSGRTQEVSLFLSYRDAWCS